jgi:hypothetical protein
MKILLLSLAVAVAGVGCGGSSPPPESSPDLAQAGVGADMATAPQSGGDMAGGGTLLPFGANCTSNPQCASNLCAQFVMGMVHRCTKTCTPATAATDCPAPADGTCNNNGECKFDN